MPNAEMSDSTPVVVPAPAQRCRSISGSKTLSLGQRTDERLAVLTCVSAALAVRHLQALLLRCQAVAIAVRMGKPTCHTACSACYQGLSTCWQRHEFHTLQPAAAGEGSAGAATGRPPAPERLRGL